MKQKPHLQLEKEKWGRQSLVCGIDEVGRGCFAGPLVAAGVILKPNLSESKLAALLSLGINDSKRVSSKAREEIVLKSNEYILYSCVIRIEVEEINVNGIGFANKKAFCEVADSIKKQTPQDIFFLTDCFPIPTVSTKNQANIIHGDQTSLSIALASIIAKVTRDTYMEKLALELPDYGFEKNKGYGTLYHREKLQELGPSIYHRTQFIQRYI